jgi:hypothetical protein
MNRFRPLEGIVKYFSGMMSEYRVECEKKDQEVKLHSKKSEYIDSLQLAIGTALQHNKTIDSNNSVGKGYYVSISDKVADTKTSISGVYPDVVITLESRNMNDMTFKVWNRYRNKVLLELPVKNDEEYKQAKHTLCDYVSNCQYPKKD